MYDGTPAAGVGGAEAVGAVLEAPAVEEEVGVAGVGGGGRVHRGVMTGRSVRASVLGVPQRVGLGGVERVGMVEYVDAMRCSSKGTAGRGEKGAPYGFRSLVGCLGVKCQESRSWDRETLGHTTHLS